VPKTYPEPVEEVQIVDSDLHLEDWKYKPRFIRRWFINNILRRMVAYLVGWTGNRAVLLRATSAGVLKVASVGAGLEQYKSNPSQTNHEDWVTVSGAAISEEDFGERFSSWLIRVKDHEMVCEISTDGITYGQKFLLRGDLNEALSQDAIIWKARFRNKVTDGTQDGSYQIIAWK